MQEIKGLRENSVTEVTLETKLSEQGKLSDKLTITFKNGLSLIMRGTVEVNTLPFTERLAGSDAEFKDIETRKDHLLQ
jgi:hypothetical protein